MILGAFLLAALTACGSSAGGGAPGIERSFTLDWHDHADSVKVRYRATSLRLHDGRWAAEVSVDNESGAPLYETTWSPTGDFGTTWNGPALVYSGLDVLGNRRLIFVAADHETPPIPYPLRSGRTWHGTVTGKLPAKPAIPRGRPIWVRYPMFGIGRPWDNYSPATAVQWISEQAVKL